MPREITAAYVFVLHIHGAGLKPHAIVRSVADDHRQRVRITSPARTDVLPACSCRIEHVDLISFLIGENQVGAIVNVQIDESQPGIAALLVDETDAIGEREGYAETIGSNRAWQEEFGMRSSKFDPLSQ